MKIVQILNIRKWILNIRKWISNIRKWISNIRKWISNIKKWISNNKKYRFLSTLACHTLRNLPDARSYSITWSFCDCCHAVLFKSFHNRERVKQNLFKNLVCLSWSKYRKTISRMINALLVANILLYLIFIFISEQFFEEH